MNVTFFAVPRPFIKDWNEIQRTAIKSWMRFGKVVLCGNEEGVQKVCDEFRITRVDIDELTLKHSFEAADAVSSTPYMCRISADCVIADGINNIPDFTDGCIIALRRESPDVVNLDTINSTYFSLPVQDEAYMDIHLFPKGFFKNIPPIRIGLGGDDSWLSKYALEHGKLIHSKDMVIIHQIHSRDYWRVPETPGYLENLALWESLGGGVNLGSANFELRNGLIFGLKEGILT